MEIQASCVCDLLEEYVRPRWVGERREARDELPQPKTWTAAEDHQNMMDQLGLRALRPGPSGDESAPNHANYDESTANPFPNLPDVLTLKNGKKISTAEIWWTDRRPEIVEDFEREVLGRVPLNVPRVTWSTSRTVNAIVGGRAVTGRQLIGHVDNSGYPLINVNIQMTFVTPSGVTRPVPVMIMFGRGELPGNATPGDRSGQAFPQVMILRRPNS
jgi:hypothetical protein